MARVLEFPSTIGPFTMSQANLAQAFNSFYTQFAYIPRPDPASSENCMSGISPHHAGMGDGDIVFCQLSPLHALTLDEETKVAANIPCNATHFAWAYPMVLEPGVRKPAGAAEVAFIEFGGYIYFDDHRTVVGTNAISLAPFGSLGLMFSPPEGTPSPSLACTPAKDKPRDASPPKDTPPKEAPFRRRLDFSSCPDDIGSEFKKKGGKQSSQFKTGHIGSGTGNGNETLEPDEKDSEFEKSDDAARVKELEEAAEQLGLALLEEVARGGSRTARVKELEEEARLRREEVAARAAESKVCVETFLVAVKKDASRIRTPIKGTILYTKHIRPSRPRGTSVDVKDSSFRCLGIFLMFLESAGLLRLQPGLTDPVVTDIYFDACRNYMYQDLFTAMSQTAPDSQAADVGANVKVLGEFSGKVLAEGKRPEKYWTPEYGDRWWYPRDLYEVVDTNACDYIRVGDIVEVVMGACCGHLGMVVEDDGSSFPYLIDLEDDPDDDIIDEIIWCARYEVKLVGY